MVRGTVEDVKLYAKKLMDYSGRFNGGFIYKWYSSPDATGHPQERILAMSEAFVKYGNYL